MQPIARFNQEGSAWTVKEVIYEKELVDGRMYYQITASKEHGFDGWRIGRFFVGILATIFTLSGYLIYTLATKKEDSWFSGKEIKNFTTYDLKEGETEETPLQDLQLLEIERVQRAFQSSGVARFADVRYETSKQKIDDVLQEVSQISERYPFNGYRLGTIQNKKEAAASYGAVPAMQEGRLVFKEQILSEKEIGHRVDKPGVEGIGSIGNLYTWVEAPSIDADVPENIQNPGVYLPDSLSIDEFNEMRQVVQKGVMTREGITENEAFNIAVKMQGIVVEATLPCDAGALLKDSEGNVDIHYIFQSGLNFNQYEGGGIPIPFKSGSDGRPEVLAIHLEKYTLENARAALNSAIRNESDVLVLNLGIGTGFFGGNYGSFVKEANINALCDTIKEAQSRGEEIQVVVPNIGLSEKQKESIEDLGIKIIPADKDAVAALCARGGLKVSLSVAADPMSMLGIHGPGLWWETVGMASDEERAAFLTPCYALAHIPIEIHQGEEVQPVAALSEFLVEEA